MNPRVADFMAYARDRGVSVPADRAEALLAEAQGGLDQAQRACKADLVTFPPEVKMASCANCKFVRPGEDYCDHEDVDQPLLDGAAHMVCGRWDAPGTDRSAQSRDAALDRFARPQAEAPTAEPWRYARRTAAPTTSLPWQQPLPPAEVIHSGRWQEHEGTGYNPAHVVSTRRGKFFVKTPEPVGDSRLGLHPQQHHVGVELAVNAIHRLIGTPHVPMLGEVRSILPAKGGKPGRALAAHLIPGETYGSAIDRDPRYIARARSGTPPDVAGRMAMANWLVNAADRHKNNYLLAPGGLVVPIDYGLSLYPRHPEDDFFDLGSDALTHRKHGLTDPYQPLDKDMARRMLANRAGILEAVQEYALPGYPPRRRQGMLEMLGRKFDILSSLARRRRPTLADLPHEPHPG
jgi:hypothetical protein